ncbi:hypothetical protein BJN45_08590 [Azonexus hydrophilus]|uniref:DUF3301 domain-containing protein n=1 Tax=Azonexus hydrophilus TaxID=418702 RepID=A0A1R1I8T6_9RHOO|nr:DUF3301 domain-containing protein [Azonexus hydrophilus]OMG55188.1 hypothetical protein BJN45_08590 [Azonexus hydrophilus]
MPIYESIFILVAAAGVWFWLDTLKAREIGILAAQNACADEGLQFLDETVIGRVNALARDDDGRLRLRRTLTFEYSDTGNNRRNGSVTLLGHQVEYLHLRPQLYVVPNSKDSHENRH